MDGCPWDSCNKESKFHKDDTELLRRNSTGQACLSRLGQRESDGGKEVRIQLPHQTKQHPPAQHGAMVKCGARACRAHAQCDATRSIAHPTARAPPAHCALLRLDTPALLSGLLLAASCRSHRCCVYFRPLFQQASGFRVHSGFRVQVCVKYHIFDCKS